MNIKGVELENNLIMEIGKFAVLWNIFEKNYCDYMCSKEKMKNICEIVSLNKEKQMNLARALNNRRIWFEQLYTDYIISNLYSDSRKPSEDEINVIEAFLKQEDDNTSYGCLLSIFRIRNNMMHGLKLVENLNEQIDIFKTANEILESI